MWRASSRSARGAESKQGDGLPTRPSLLTVVTYDVAGLSQPQRPPGMMGLEMASPDCAAIVTRWLGKLGPVIVEKKWSSSTKWRAEAPGGGGSRGPHCSAARATPPGVPPAGP